jgi:hypothetical protein
MVLDENYGCVKCWKEQNRFSNLAFLIIAYPRYMNLKPIQEKVCLNHIKNIDDYLHNRVRELSKELPVTQTQLI